MHSGKMKLLAEHGFKVTFACMLQISGESGSGKTEAAKLTLQYLAAVTSHHRECHAVKYQILQSNPVLEGESSPYLVIIGVFFG